MVPTAPRHPRSPSAAEAAAYAAKVAAEDALLAREAAAHPDDLILVPVEDFYGGLSRKLKEAYRWATERTAARWFLKTDDDTYARVGALEAPESLRRVARAPAAGTPCRWTSARRRRGRARQDSGRCR